MFVLTNINKLKYQVVPGADQYLMGSTPFIQQIPAVCAAALILLEHFLWLTSF